MKNLNGIQSALNQCTWKVDMHDDLISAAGRVLQLSVQSLPGFRAACESNFSKVREKWLPFTTKDMNDKTIL